MLRTLATLIVRGFALAFLVVAVVVALLLWQRHEQNAHIEQAAERAEHAYAHIHKGAGAASVRRLAGTPTNIWRYDDDGRSSKRPCWEYANGPTPTTVIVDYCFADGKLVSKSIGYCDLSTEGCYPSPGGAHWVVNRAS